MKGKRRMRKLILTIVENLKMSWTLVHVPEVTASPPSRRWRSHHTANCRGRPAAHGLVQEGPHWMVPLPPSSAANIMRMVAGAHTNDSMSSSELSSFQIFPICCTKVLIIVYFYYTNDNLITNTKDTLFAKYDGFKSLITNVMCIVCNWDNGNKRF